MTNGMDWIPLENQVGAEHEYPTPNESEVSLGWRIL